jgi:hypothetical protein
VRLLTGYADVPLALLVAPGLAAAARWLLTRERFLLELATLLFGAAALTKNEGLIFVLAAYLALLVCAPRAWRRLLASALAVEALLLPWQLYVRVHDIASDSVFSAALRWDGVHLGIAPIALRRLVQESASFRQWSLLPALVVAALLLAAWRRRRLALFAAVWVGAVLAAETWIYTSSGIPYSDYLDFSASRIVSALVLGAAALVPLLAAPPLYDRR